VLRLTGKDEISPKHLELVNKRFLSGHLPRYQEKKTVYEDSSSDEDDDDSDAEDASQKWSRQTIGVSKVLNSV